MKILRHLTYFKSIFLGLFPLNILKRDKIQGNTWTGCKLSKSICIVLILGFNTFSFCRLCLLTFGWRLLLHLQSTIIKRAQCGAKSANKGYLTIVNKKFILLIFLVNLFHSFLSGKIQKISNSIVNFSSLRNS